jgi:hypothetical protein
MGFLLRTYPAYMFKEHQEITKSYTLNNKIEQDVEKNTNLASFFREVRSLSEIIERSPLSPTGTTPAKSPLFKPRMFNPFAWADTSALCMDVMPCTGPDLHTKSPYIRQHTQQYLFSLASPLKDHQLIKLQLDSFLRI